jgi:hypothetical protein
MKSAVNTIHAEWCVFIDFETRIILIVSKVVYRRSRRRTLFHFTRIEHPPDACPSAVAEG